MRRTRIGQYQASLAVLGWLGSVGATWHARATQMAGLMMNGSRWWHANIVCNKMSCTIKLIIIIRLVHYTRTWLYWVKLVCAYLHTPNTSLQYYGLCYTFTYIVIIIHVYSIHVQACALYSTLRVYMHETCRCNCHMRLFLYHKGSAISRTYSLI